MLKNLPIGYDNFKEVIEEDLYYVDKTDIMSELLSKKNKVSLFPRPRRFGKSLFISMMDNFLNIEYAGRNDDLFDGLKISKSNYYKELSTRPVIKLDFKSLKQDNFDSMFNMFKEKIRELYSSKKYLLEVLDEEDSNLFYSFVRETAIQEKYENSLKILSDFMFKYYNKKVVILIDEYDVPIQEGYLKDFYDNIVRFIRNVFSNALKGNDNIDFAIMTGVLRVSKESLFSDLNNVEVYGITNKFYNECFGFTERETTELLEYYNLELTSDVKNMYDGYNFNGTEIYNPWSILNYAKYNELEPFWINTSGNELIKNCIINCDENVKVVIEKLLSGDSVKFVYNDKVTYLDFNELKSFDNILNLLFISGYLTIDRYEINEFNNKVTFVKIPNEEVKSLFKNILVEILKNDYRINDTLMENFCSGILNNNVELIQTSLNKILPNISYMDSEESFYHGYLLGLFSLFLNNKDFIVRSNREAGIGRFDLMIKKKDYSLGMIIELKITDGDMESEVSVGLDQIEEKKYYLDLVSEGVKTIYKYCICFKDKMSIVKNK